MSLFSIPPLLARSISSRARKKEVKIEFRFQCSSTLYTILFASSNNICGDKRTKRKFVDCSNLIDMLYVYCISVSMLTAHTHISNVVYTCEFYAISNINNLLYHSLGCGAYTGWLTKRAKEQKFYRIGGMFCMWITEIAVAISWRSFQKRCRKSLCGLKQPMSV